MHLVLVELLTKSILISFILFFEICVQSFVIFYLSFSWTKLFWFVVHWRGIEVLYAHVYRWLAIAPVESFTVHHG